MIFPPSFATVVTVGQVVPDFYPYLKKEQLPETKVNDKENNSKYWLLNSAFRIVELDSVLDKNKSPYILSK